MAIGAKDGTVSLYALEDFSDRVLIDKWDGPYQTVLKFSPDSETLLYSHPGLGLVSRALKTGQESIFDTRFTDAAIFARRAHCCYY